jgi:opacity protein-like surface antigen
MRRLSIVVGLVALISAAAPATGYAQQSLNFYLGGFTLKGEDARDRNDVLRNNLDFLTFNIEDFNGATAGGEYLVGMGDFLEAGLGVGIYKRTVPSFYTFKNEDGFSIDQDLKLRVVPFTATVRFLPLGRTGGVEPYIGAGVAVLNYRYSESGDFLFDDGVIRRDSFVGSGTATGPMVLGGVRFPVGPWAIGGEIRYQDAHGDLPLDQDFSGSRMDLGGWTYAATFKVRF